MNIDKNLVEHLARLSKLEFSEAEKEQMIFDLNKILGLVDKLEEVNTENVQPLVYMTDEKNVLRTDTQKTLNTKVEALSNAPEKDSDYIKVPKVIQ